MSYSIIIAEFNPLSNGHKYLIEQTKELFPLDKIVVVMSGNWVQRGEPAITDKYSRAQASLDVGADLVIELPTIYSISSAEDFAFGAIKIATTLKSAKRIVFGSECGDIKAIAETANLLISQKFDSKIKKQLSLGESYASAIRQVFGKNSILSSPNNLLAVEYVKALKKQNSHLEAVTIKRSIDNYNDDDLSEFASSSALRKHLLMGEYSSLEDYMPIEMLKRINPAHLPDFNSLYPLIVFKLHTLTFSEIEKFEGICEGLEYRLFEQSKLSKNLDDFLLNIASKRYPANKIKRILLNLIFGVTKHAKKDAKPQFPPIIVLAVKNKSILKDPDLCCAIKQFNDHKNILPHQQEVIKINQLADIIYASITNHTIKETITHKL